MKATGIIITALILLMTSMAVAQENPVSLIPTVSIAQQCSGYPAEYQFTLINNQQFSESFEISGKAFKEYLAVSENPIVVEPGQQKDVFVYLDLPGRFTEAYEFDVTFTALRSQAVIETPITLYTEDCFSHTLERGESLYFGEEVLKVTDFEENYQVCQSEQRYIPLDITNTGDFEQNFVFNLTGGPEWVTLDTGEIMIQPGQRTRANILLAVPPNQELNSSVELIVEPDFGTATLDSFNISSKNCFFPIIASEGESRITITEKETITAIPLLNSGRENATYTVELESEEGWITIQKRNIEIIAGESENIQVKTSPSEFVENGLYPFTLVVTAPNGIQYEREFEFALGSIVGHSINAFFTRYIWYFTAAFWAIIIAGLLWLLRQQQILDEEGRGKKVDIRYVSKKTKPIKRFFKKEYRVLGIGAALVITSIILFFIVRYLFDILEPVSGVMQAYRGYIATGVLLAFAAIVYLLNKERSTVKRKAVVEQKQKRPLKELFTLHKFKLLVAGIILLVVALFTWVYIRFTDEIEDFYYIYQWYLIGALAALIILGIVAFIVLRKPKSEKKEEPTKKVQETKTAEVMIKEAEIVPEIKEKPKAVKKEKATKEPFNKTPLVILLVVLAIVAVGTFIWYIIDTELYMEPYIMYTGIGLGLASAIILFYLLRFFQTRQLCPLEHYRVGEHVSIGMKPGTGLGELHFTMNNMGSGAFYAKGYGRANPTFLKAANQVYSYFELSPKDIGKDVYSNLHVRFSVSKKWLNDKDETSIVLRRYFEGKWIDIPTNKIRDDSDRLYFEAYIDHLSYFAIVATRKKKQGVLVKKEKTSLWPIFFVALVVLLLGVGTYTFLQGDNVVGNETAPVGPVENELIDSDYSLDEDTVLTLDLTEMFADPDGDSLTYKSEGSEHIIVTIEENEAYVIPEEDWSGVESIVFTADDGKGGVVSTDPLVFQVVEVPEPTGLAAWYQALQNSEDPNAERVTRSEEGFNQQLLTYRWYILAGLVILVIVVLFFVHHKKIIDFLEEEPPKK